MKVRETLKIELDALMQDLIGKIDTDKPELTVNEVFDLAEKCKAFDQNTYVYSNDTETLYDLLVYSLGLCNIWANYKKDKPDAQITEVNWCIIEFMKHMWGLDKIRTMEIGRAHV